MSSILKIGAKIQQKLHICKKKQKKHNLLFKGVCLFVLMNEGIVFPSTNGGVRFTVGSVRYLKMLLFLP